MSQRARLGEVVPAWTSWVQPPPLDRSCSVVRGMFLDICFYGEAACLHKSRPETSPRARRQPDDTFAQMLPGMSEEDRKRAALVSQLVKTLKANPNYITGRQVFLRYIMQKASTLETSLGVGSRYKRPRIMKQHGAHWEKLTADAKRAYEQRRLRQSEHPSSSVAVRTWRHYARSLLVCVQRPARARIRRVQCSFRAVHWTGPPCRDLAV